MKNIITLPVEEDKEYVTKADLALFGVSLKTEIVTELKSFIQDSFEHFAHIMAGSFEMMNKRIDQRFERIENDIAQIKEIMATKQDILAIHDKYVPYYKFDELSLRVYKLEEGE